MGRGQRLSRRVPADGEAISRLLDVVALNLHRCGLHAVPRRRELNRKLRVRALADRSLRLELIRKSVGASLTTRINGLPVSVSDEPPRFRMRKRDSAFSPIRTTPKSVPSVAPGVMSLLTTS